MKIKKETVGEVVAEASKKMSDPNYSAVLVGGFVQEQADSAQYLTAHSSDMGGAEGVVNAIFHASLISLCFQRAYGRSVPRMQFDDLDHVSGGDRKASLQRQQPHILEYIDTNIELPAMREALMLLALCMESLSR